MKSNIQPGLSMDVYKFRNSCNYKYLHEKPSGWDLVDK